MEESQTNKVADTKIYKALYPFVRPYIRRFTLLIFFIVSLACLASSRPFLFRYTIDNHIAAGDIDSLKVVIAIVLVSLLIQFVMEYLETYFSGWLGQTIIKDIRLKLYSHLLHHRLRFFDHNPIGRLITRNISDIETLSNVFSEGVAAIFADLLQLLFILGFMFYTDWRLTLVSLSTLPFLLISTYVFKEKIKHSFQEVRIAVAALNTFVQEHITGMSVVQLFNSEKKEFEKFVEINKQHRLANIKSVWYYSVYFPIAEMISATGIGLLVWYGAHEIVKDQVTLGVVVAFIMYINMFFRPIRMIADKLNTLQMGVVSSERIIHLLKDNDHVQYSGNYIPSSLRGDIEFSHVSFSYNVNEPVLNDISFQVRKGELLAIVGATGAGKSSIINLLNRFYSYEKGMIRLDGEELEKFELSWLRQRIGVVLQDVFLFSDSIINNITLWDSSITREKVIEVSKMLGADKFIERLPGSYDYNVMERGATLSVGQRQLISFVRAMVHDPTVLILDEATSSVDDESEKIIQAAIEKMMQGRTSIVIAHRLSTIRAANNILVLEKGKIVESGSHSHLIQQKGAYSALYKMQFKEVLR